MRDCSLLLIKVEVIRIIDKCIDIDHLYLLSQTCI